MTRDEAQVARSIDLYRDLDNRIRAARAVAFWCVIATMPLAIGTIAALAQGAPWNAAADVWLPLAAAFAGAALAGRVNLATLKERRRVRDDERRLVELRAQARRMRIAGAFAGVIVGELAVKDAVDRRAAA